MTSRIISSLAWLVVAPVLLVVIGIASCEVRKVYYDRHVQRLCERHGGVQVYERMEVSEALFNELGGQGGLMWLPNERERTSRIPAYQVIHDPILIKDGFPSIARHEATVVRAADATVLGRAIYFSRGGGDFPFTGSAPSYFQCPAASDLVREVLKKEAP